MSSGHQADERRLLTAYACLPASHGFVVGKDLVCQLVDKLIKTQVHLVKRKQGDQWQWSGLTTELGQLGGHQGRVD